MIRRTVTVLLVFCFFVSSLCNAEVVSTIRYPVGDEQGNGWLENRGGLQYLRHWNYEGACSWVKQDSKDLISLKEFYNSQQLQIYKVTGSSIKDNTEIYYYIDLGKSSKTNENGYIEIIGREPIVQEILNSFNFIN